MSVPRIEYITLPSIADQRQIIALLDSAFQDPIYSTNTKNAFFCGYVSSYCNFVLLKSEETLIGVAIVARRKIKFLNENVDALTTGPLAIDPTFQRQGYSEKLMTGIEELGKKMGVVVIYLQGIDGFYARYGYYSCLSKSKIILKSSHLDNVKKTKCEPLTVSNIAKAVELYDRNMASCSLVSERNADDWHWLVTYARHTWYFYSPMLVTKEDKVVGYFCSDPRAPGRIREAVFGNSYTDISSFLSGLRGYAKLVKVDSLEVMTWIGSPLYQYAKANLDATFLQFIKADGSQVMKIIDQQKCCELINRSILGKFEVESIEQQDQSNIFHVRHQNKKHALTILNRHVPGFLAGYIDDSVIVDLDKVPATLRSKIREFLVRLHPPFICQGDNL